MAARQQFLGFDLQFLVKIQTGMFHAHYSFVIVSSMFSSTRDASVHAATLCRFTSAGGFFASGDATSIASGRAVFKIFFLLVHERQQLLRLERVRLPSRAQTERIHRPFLLVLAALFANPQRQPLRRFIEHRVVQRRQRLQRRVGHHPPHAHDIGVRRVENGQRRIRHAAFPERVHRPAKFIVPFADFPGHRRAISQPQHAIGNRRINARTADLVSQHPRRLERDVVDHFRIHAEPRPALEQTIILIFGEFRRRHLRRLPVGRGFNDQPVHRFHVPAFVHEFAREPVQQFGMRRLIALRSEILRRDDDAAPEIFLPETVHGHARRERVLFIHEPFAERQPVVRFTPFGSGGRNAGTSGCTSSRGLRKSPRLKICVTRGSLRALSTIVVSAVGHSSMILLIFSLPSRNRNQRCGKSLNSARFCSGVRFSGGRLMACRKSGSADRL